MSLFHRCMRCLSTHRREIGLATGSRIEFRLRTSGRNGTYIPGHHPHPALYQGLVDFWQVNPWPDEEGAVAKLLFWHRLGFHFGLLLEFLPLLPLLSFVGHSELLRGGFACLVLHNQRQSGSVNPRPGGHAGSKEASEREQEWILFSAVYNPGPAFLFRLPSPTPTRLTGILGRGAAWVQERCTY